jgi:glutamine amidotransferase
MAKKIAIIDYGLGNLRSIKKGFEKVGAEPFITDDEDR